MGLCFAHLKLCTWSIKKKSYVLGLRRGRIGMVLLFFFFFFLVMKSCILCGIDIELYVGLVLAVLGFFFVV